MAGSKPINAMAARYPDAPACPTEEYRRATEKNKVANSAEFMKGVSSMMLMELDQKHVSWNDAMLHIHQAMSI